MRGGRSVIKTFTQKELWSRISSWPSPRYIIDAKHASTVSIYSSVSTNIYLVTLGNTE